MLDELKEKASDLLENPNVQDAIDKAKDFVAENKDKITDFVKEGKGKDLIDAAKEKLGDIADNLKK